MTCEQRKRSQDTRNRSGWRPRSGGSRPRRHRTRTRRSHRLVRVCEGRPLEDGGSPFGPSARSRAELCKGSKSREEGADGPWWDGEPPRNVGHGSEKSVGNGPKGPPTIREAEGPNGQ